MLFSVAEKWFDTIVTCLNFLLYYPRLLRGSNYVDLLAYMTWMMKWMDEDEGLILRMFKVPTAYSIYRLLFAQFYIESKMINLYSQIYITN